MEFKYTTLELLGALFFALAITHTFVVSRFIAWSHHFPKDSLRSNALHLLGEIEAVFALWASLFMVVFIAMEGWAPAIAYQDSLNFIEPFFVFAIMVLCATRPILTAARQGILFVSSCVQKIARTPVVLTDVFMVLALGSLSGSLITEPAAMTVTAFLLNSLIPKQSEKLLYALLAVLFVNISIGGSLTPFAAPPILMVASKWNWDLSTVFMSFGWRSSLAVCINSLGFVLIFSKELSSVCIPLRQVEERIASSHVKMPTSTMIVHLLFLLGIVLTSHHQNAFMGLFLLFLGLAAVTRQYHDNLRLKESLLVALFLGGIIQFGALQKWWLEPVLSSLSDGALFFGATLLTAITDNAALTFLGSQVEGLTESGKYFLVAGALAGGGLTIVANAPNAAGYSILSHKFQQGLKPLNLLLAALAPTAVAVSCLFFL